MIYLDNAATTKMSDVALDALISVNRESFGNPSSIYQLGRKARDILNQSRSIIADCIGTEPDEIYFTSCGTESDNWAISQCKRQKVKKIITSQIEHRAVLNPVRLYETEGITANYLPVDENGIVSTSALRKSIDGTKVLTSIMLQNNETGVVQPIKDISRIVHSDNKESLVHTDAVQALGHADIDVKELDIDMLSASAHKFNGPKGIGFMYVRKTVDLSPFIYGGGQEFGFRSGTENVAEIYSMARALEDNCKNLEKHRAFIAKLEELLFRKLIEAGVRFQVNGDETKRATGVLNVSLQDVDGEGLLNMLDAHGICISTGSACNSRDKERSHVLKAMHIEDERIDSAIRISIGRFNTEEDIIELVHRIGQFFQLTKKALQ